MSQPYFVRTVPDASHVEGDLERKLDIVVRNTGNHFFESAVARQLSNAQTLWDLEELQEEDATVVLSMSNFISPSTDLGDVADVLERKKVARVVMIGAGAQAEAYGDIVELSAGTRRFIALLAERSASIGVRGDYTAEVLHGLGLRNVDVIGCPSMFYHCDPSFQVQQRPLPARGARVAFHCTPTGFYRDSIARLLAFGVQHCSAYVAQSETYLLGLVSSAPEHLKMTKFFFHYYNDDTLSHEMLRGWFEKNTHWFFNLETWFDFMRGMDFSVGSRFHGNMAALLSGVPALGLVFDTRTRELCEYLNLPTMQLQDFGMRETLQSLHERADFSVFNATFPAKYMAYREFLLKNGLETTLPPVSPPEHRIDAVRRKALARLANDLADAGVCPSGIRQALAARLSTTRGSDERQRVEAGEFERARAAEHDLVTTAC